MNSSPHRLVLALADQIRKVKLSASDRRTVGDYVREYNLNPDETRLLEYVLVSKQQASKVELNIR